MSQIARNRTLSWVLACSDVRHWARGESGHGLQDKSTACRRADMVGGVGDLEPRTKSPAGAFSEIRTNSMLLEPSLIPNLRRLQ